MSVEEQTVNREFAKIIEQAYRISDDVGQEVESVLDVGRANPLDQHEARLLLTKIIAVLRTRQAKVTGSNAQLKAEEIETLVAEIVSARAQLPREVSAQADKQPTVQLITHDGISPRPVKPSPVFHTRSVALKEGYIRTRDLSLWQANERLEIHIQQFQRLNKRAPNPQELLDIMFSDLKLEGVTKDDQFKIPALAYSIAVNGVRKPPIIDVDGTLLDGNRRVAACYYIMASDDFTPEQKKRVEHLLVQQLTEHATSEDRDSIIVSLNFEPDHKQDWPEYVKARKVYEHWQEALAIEPHANQRRQAQIKREISQKFALGADGATVNRYIKMVQWADEFEDYHILEKKRDRYLVKHRAARYFQYFDEIQKGNISSKLQEDPALKHLVFELLYEGKFSNWNKIRDIRLIADNEEARGILKLAAADPVETPEQLEDAQEKVENALSIGRARRAELRYLGANTRIETFVEWLMDLPLKAFQDEIKAENVAKLQRALKFVEGITRDQPSDSNNT